MSRCSPTIGIVPQVIPNSRIKYVATDSASLNSETSSHIQAIDAPSLVRLWHLASFDAPTVAIAWSLAFAWIVRVHLPLWVPVLLALSVWTVYVADRLLDARTGLRFPTHDRLRDRHLFHWRHRRVLLPLAALAASIAAWMIFAFMPVVARERDSLLAAASVVYFTRVHTGRRLFPSLPKFVSKELLVGLLFTAGCALPAWSRTSLPHRILPLMIPVSFFALLAWLNCHAIDRWEANSDRTSQLTIFPAASLLALAGLLLITVLSAPPRSAALLASGAAAALLLALLDRLRKRLTPIALRAAADLALLTPALLIPFAPLLK